MVLAQLTLKTYEKKTWENAFSAVRVSGVGRWEIYRKHKLVKHI